MKINTYPFRVRAMKSKKIMSMFIRRIIYDNIIIEGGKL